MFKSYSDISRVRSNVLTFLEDRREWSHYHHIQDLNSWALWLEHSALTNSAVAPLTTSPVEIIYVDYVNQVEK